MRWFSNGGYASGGAALNIQVPRGPAPGNMRMSPSEQAERSEMDSEVLVTDFGRQRVEDVNAAAVEKLMEDLAVADESTVEISATDQTASILMGAVSAAVRGDLPLMKQLVGSLSVDEVPSCYQAVNILLANLLAKDAAGNIKEYK